MSDPKQQPRNFLDGLGASDPLIQDSLRAIWARSQQKAAQEADQAAAEPTDSTVEPIDAPAASPVEMPAATAESEPMPAADEPVDVPVSESNGDGTSGMPDLLGLEPDDNPFQALDQAVPAEPTSRDAGAATRRSLIRRLYEADGGQGRDHVFRTTTRTAPNTASPVAATTQRAMILRQGPQGVEGLAELNAALLQGWHVVHTTGLPLTVTGDVPDGVQFAALVVLEQAGATPSEHRA